MNVVWFRRDLRVKDNPALYYASKEKAPLMALYIRTPETWKTHHMSVAQQSWLEDNLSCLETSLHTLGIPLHSVTLKRFCEVAPFFKTLVKRFGVKTVCFNKEYPFDEIKRDNQVGKVLQQLNVNVKTFDDSCLIAPEAIRNQSDKPYTVFTPYKKQVIKTLLEDESLLKVTPPIKKRQQASVSFSNTAYHAPKCREDLSWLHPSEKSAHKKLKIFVEKDVQTYQKERDYPSIDTTSRLSPYLAIGVLSPRQCVNALLDAYDLDSLKDLLEIPGPQTWLSELIWRDFYRMICVHFPYVSKGQPFNQATNQLVWSTNQAHFKAWCEGQTGVPIVDSAMRQLNQTSWMHNRLRMITAMYLTKNLWHDWRKGEAYFASRLVDWDFASNNGGWQWSASTGTDAAPYFRIFNPITQSERFDADGDFIRAYCPELDPLDKKAIHEPNLDACKNHNYPPPLVDLKTSRKKAIERFKALKS